MMDEAGQVDALGLRKVAVAAARVGAAAALPFFRRPDLAVEWKADESPVTVADRACEGAIRAHLAQARPADAWLGEETGTAAGTSGLGWIVDPIDGTRNFVRGVPLWSTLVACARLPAAGEPEVLAACVLLPALDECYDAALGAGARCNGQPIHVSAIDRLDQSMWCFETPTWFRSQGLSKVFAELEEQCALSRGLSDAYGHMLVASGRAELMVEPQLAMWDVAATSLVVREAGGRFSDLDGKEPGMSSGHAVVSNGLVHDQALALIARHRQRPSP
ncbi:MAG: histidinol phosphatase [Planctomycetota bacterium]|nr:MAG: histidinol phosphatase [Planctomycetota bacterium]